MIFSISCCIDVNMSRTAASGRKHSINAFVLHKRHAKNMFRTAIVTRDKPSKSLVVIDC